MKHAVYIIVGSLLALGLVIVLVLGLGMGLFFPARQSTFSTVTTLTDTEITFLGTTFTIPAGLGDQAFSEIIQPSDGFFTTWPTHTRSILENYPLTDTIAQPRILVFSTSEYTQLSPDAAAIIEDLRTTLQSHELAAADPLPYLPLERAQQVFHAQEKFLSFQNGNGLRYLTQYSQAAFPVQNLSHLELLYTFQGLSSDGKYYVSVILPVRLEYVTVDEADDSPFPEHGIPFNWDNPNPAQYPDYLDKAVSMLNHSNNPFNPSLETLDALVQSILVGVEQ
jgi:hypothetical protein